MSGKLGWTLVAVLAVCSPALPCTICGGSPQTTTTYREEMARANLVLYGTLANARLVKGAGGAQGMTDLNIERVLKSDAILNNRKVIELPRYVPADPKDPPKFLVFCYVENGKLDPYRGVPVKSLGLVDYVRGVGELNPKDRGQSLAHAFRFLDHADPDVANDAFVEFARASDQEVGQAARKLAPDKLRHLLRDPRTPANRLGLCAFLLGACGGDDDAALLRGMVEKPNERTTAAMGGIMAGLIELRPREGWVLTYAILGEARRPFPERLAVLGTLRFLQGWKPEESRREVLRGLDLLLDQGDIADLAIEDLRRGQVWDLTPRVLAQFGKKSHDAPIMRRAIIRHALCSKHPSAAEFLKKIGPTQAEEIREIEESLQIERRN